MIPSSHTSYPEHYKFTSLNFFVTPQTPVVTRFPYGILDYIGDIGGLLEAVKTIGKFVTFVFSAHNLSAILALKLYVNREINEIEEPSKVEYMSKIRMSRTKTSL